LTINFPYVSLLCDITTDISVAKKLILKVSYRYSFCFYFFIAHIYSTWPLFLVINGPLGHFFSEAEQNTALVLVGGYVSISIS